MTPFLPPSDVIDKWRQVRGSGYIIIIIILYLSAHVQHTKQALGIAPHEALCKKNKHTQKSLLRHYEELLTITQISSSTSF